MRDVLDLRALRVVRAECNAPCTGGRGRAACALGAVMCCVLLVYGRGVMYAGGYLPCTALYAGEREGELCLLEGVGCAWVWWVVWVGLCCWRCLRCWGRCCVCWSVCWRARGVSFFWWRGWRSLELMRRVMLCMLEAAEGELCSLEAL